MPPVLPDGDPVPPDGALPPSARGAVGLRPFGVYLHVPFCRVRCGYCDFNTYTFPELSTRPEGPVASAGQDGWTTEFLRAAHAELDLAEAVLGGMPAVSTVFVGGGTPTLLAPTDLTGLLGRIRSGAGLVEGAEVTTEANPDTVDAAVADSLAAGGFTRVSLGMQSAVPHVLATLDRTHDPAHVATAVAAVRAAGMQVSLDLIYGTPGESLSDWRRSLETVLALAPDHASAYALVVEPGTRLAAQVRRGEVPMPDDDDAAARYELADELLGAAGYGWYEVSNWARGIEARCRHNLGYWRGDDWWGIGPGAHSHVGGVRWWNVKHPRAYAARLAGGGSPAAAREVLTAEQRHDEEVLLGLRLEEGLATDRLSAGGRSAVAGLIADGLVDGRAAVAGRLRLTRRGRLLTDTVVHRVL